MLYYIERFGVQAIMGRAVLGAGEARRMAACDNLAKAYQSRAAYRDADGNENWAEWAERSPDSNRMLTGLEAALAAPDEGTVTSTSAGSRE